MPTECVVTLSHSCSPLRWAVLRSGTRYTVQVLDGRREWMVGGTWDTAAGARSFVWSIVSLLMRRGE